MTSVLYVAKSILSFPAVKSIVLPHASKKAFWSGRESIKRDITRHQDNMPKRWSGVSGSKKYVYTASGNSQVTSRRIFALSIAVKSKRNLSSVSLILTADIKEIMISI